jgi:hypothetical protein
MTNQEIDQRVQSAYNAGYVAYRDCPPSIRNLSYAKRDELFTWMGQQLHREWTEARAYSRGLLDASEAK